MKASPISSAGPSSFRGGRYPPIERERWKGRSTFVTEPLCLEAAMLTCMPQSLCSWDFRVVGLSTGSATLEFDFLTEQGSISLGGIDQAIRKHGVLSGHWTLERDEAMIAEAKKPNVLSRPFDVRSGSVQLTVRSHSAFSRCFDLFQSGEVVGRIRPAHPFTRRAAIECDSSVPEPVQLFAFWLVVITWRRSARNS